MYYHKSPKALERCNKLNFILTPHAVMNEVFYEPIEHNQLQDWIHMFTLHIHSKAT